MKTNNLFKAVFLTALMLFGNASAWGQRAVIAAWSFPTTSGEAPAILSAECGKNHSSSTLYADGTNGSSNLVPAVRRYYAGVGYGAGLCTNLATGAYTIVGNAPQSIVFKISTEGFQGIELRYDTRKTATGYTTQTWEYSTDGSNFTGIKTINGTSKFAPYTVDFSAITEIDDIAIVYIRVTLSGATSSTGNNRLDNIYFSGKTLSECTSPSTVTLMDRDVVFETLTQNVCTEELILPEPATFDDCSLWTFAGWKEGSEQEESDVKPILIAAGAGYTPSEDVTLYAVYERTVKRPALNISILPADFNGTSYAANDGTHTKGGMEYITYNMMRYEGLIRMRNDAGYMYNTSPLPQGTNITINIVQGIATFYQGTSENPLINSESLDVGENTISLMKANQYFRLMAGSGSPRLSAITINVPSSSTYYTSDPACPPILQSFTVKWSDATITPPTENNAGTIDIATLNTDQSDCMEVYFGLDEYYYAAEDYTVYLSGAYAVDEELGTSVDMYGKPSKYVCFTDVEDWTGTLVVKKGSETVETYSVHIGSRPEVTNLSNPGSKEIKDTQCHTVTGIRVDCNQAQGIIIKRTIFKDASTGTVKELK